MNASSTIRKPRLILAALAAAATLAVGSQLVLSQAAPPRAEGRSAAPPQDGPQDGPRGPGADGPGRPEDGPRGTWRGGEGPGRPGQRPMPAREAVQLTGTVSNYSFGPRGDIRALMIKSSDKTIQVNLPPPLAPFAAQLATAGAQVKLTAYPEMGLPDHPVYELASLSNEQGRELKAPSPEDRKFVHEEGTVKSLNYARHGEVDGAVMENGDFVHVGPAAAELKLTVGQKITVDGVGHPMMLSEHKAVEAVAIDGKMLQREPRPDARGGPEGGGPQGEPEGLVRRRGGRGRGGPGGLGGDGSGNGPGGGGPDGPGGREGFNGPRGPGGPGGGGFGPRRSRGPQGRPDGADAPPPRPQGGRGGDDLQPPPRIEDESDVAPSF